MVMKEEGLGPEEPGGHPTGQGWDVDSTIRSQCTAVFSGTFPRERSATNLAFGNPRINRKCRHVAEGSAKNEPQNLHTTQVRFVAISFLLASHSGTVRTEITY